MKTLYPSMLLAVLTGCGVGGGGSSPKTVHLRPGTVVVHQGKAADPDAVFQCNQEPALCAAEIVRLTDAEADGERVVLGVSTSMAPPVDLFVSDDLGRTWTEHVMPSGFDRVEEFSGGTATGGLGLGVHLNDGNVYLALDGAHNDGEFDFPFIQFAKADLTKNDYTFLNRGLGARFFWDGSTVTQANDNFDPRLGTATNVQWEWFDLEGVNAGASGMAPILGVDDGDDWVPWAGYLTSLYAGSCRSDILLTASAPADSCLDRLASPLPLTGGGTFVDPFLLGNEVGYVYSDRGHAFFVEFASPMAVKLVVDLGPGQPAHDPLEMGTDHPLFGGLVDVLPPNGDSEEARLVRIDDDGSLERADVPPNPCDPVSDCAFDHAYQYGDLARLIHLSGDDYLAVWILQLGVGGVNQQNIVVGKWHATFTPDHPTKLPPHAGPFAATDAARGLSLDAACLRAVSCGLTTSGACYDRWTTRATAAGVEDAAYDAFVNTPVGPCSNFATSYPDQFPGMVDCALGCAGDVATSACPPPGTEPPDGGTVEGVVQEDCASEGKGCAVDAEGRGTCVAPTTLTCDVCDGDAAVSCAGGEPVETACAASGFVCRETSDVGGSSAACWAGQCPAGEKRSCEGTVVHGCDPETGDVTGSVDCGRFGASCTVDTGCTPARDATCALGNEQHCEGGKYVGFCVAGEVRYLDCTTLGFTGCASTYLGVQGYAAQCANAP